MNAAVRVMRSPDRPRAESVLLVNEQAEALKEELAVGLRQARNLDVLRDTRREQAARLAVTSRCVTVGTKPFARPTSIRSSARSSTPSGACG
jgi:hypothetical protein